MKKLSDFASDTADIEIGMEATGHYWLSIYSFLIEKGFAVHVINPIQTDGWRKGTEIRKRKTDVIDSVLIADLIRYGDFVETSLSDEDTMSLRNLSRFRNYLISSIGDLKRKVICVLDQVFPEYQSVFSNVSGKTSTEILLHFQTADDFENITAEQLDSILENVTLKSFAKNKVSRISELAADSFGLKFCRDSFSLQLKLLIEQIRFIEAQVTAYAGIDASVSQSGEYQSSNNRMSKRGSPCLRKALFNAALVAAFSNPVLSAFYQNKRNEGKHHLTAIGTVARRLCNTVFAVLKHNTPYEIQLK